VGEVLDYSAGFPAASAIRAGGYVGVVRYAGTPGRSKNLTPGESSVLLAAGVPIGLVYEAGASWALGGDAVGASAARAVLADAATCAVVARCVYFAVDFDVTDSAQMAAVERTLDGAAKVLGRGRVGVYGEADVIDACVPAHAAYGWQTRAWSGGRISSRAALLQQIGYVYPGGVQCDRSTVLQPDWGQWPYQGGLTMADAASIEAKLDDMYRLIVFGDAPDNQTNPDGTPVDRGGHPNNLERVTKRVDAATAAANAVGAKVDALAAALALIAGGGTVDPVAVAAAIDLQALATLLAPQIAAHVQLRAV
jgi:hypothetical protein